MMLQRAEDCWQDMWPNGKEKAKIAYDASKSRGLLAGHVAEW